MPMTFADRLMDRLFRWLDAPQVRQAAGEVARECRSAVWNHVSERTRGMTGAQVRGYIRAVAPDYVAAVVDAVLSWRRLDAQLRPYVVDEAIQQLIDLVAQDVRHTRHRRAVRAKAA
jgi:hypothetical protein